MRKNQTTLLLLRLHCQKYIHACNNSDPRLTDGDTQVRENSVRVFANRRHCKEELDVESQYLIMGKDGSTRDSEGRSVGGRGFSQGGVASLWLTMMLILQDAIPAGFQHLGGENSFRRNMYQVNQNKSLSGIQQIHPGVQNQRLQAVKGDVSSQSA